MPHPRDEQQVFTFEDATVDPATRTTRCTYGFDGGNRFTETLTFDPRLTAPGRSLDSPEFHRLLRGLHLMGGINYYKAAAPPRLEIRSQALSPDQATFWSHLYLHGLGEFLYVNDLSPSRIARFPASRKPAESAFSTPAKPGHKPRFLVLMGGGKDSVVTAQFLTSVGADFEFFSFGNHDVHARVAEALGHERPHWTTRTIDKELLRLNAEGWYNGHVPFSAHLAFIATAAAWLGGFDYVVASNEHSANYGNVVHRGMSINHQYSKSEEFEHYFREYSGRFLTHEVTYFSLLRELHELEIMALFADSGRPAFSHFTSCNRNFSIAAGPGGARRRWCGECPKCVFSYLLLDSFLTEEELLAIFGQNLLDRESLLPLYRELFGLEGIKPLECVGTPEEVQAAFLLSCAKREKSAAPREQILEKLLPEIVSSAASLPEYELDTGRLHERLHRRLHGFLEPKQ